MHKEASGLYLSALKRKPTNVDAKIGLKATGQQVLNDFGSKFYQAHQGGDHKAAVYNYLDAKAFVDKTSRYVELSMPPYYADYYETSKEKYLSGVYEDANRMLDVAHH